MAAASIIIVIVAALVFLAVSTVLEWLVFLKYYWFLQLVFVGGILSYNDLGGLTGIREVFLRFHGSAFLVRALKTVFLVYFLW